MANYITRGGDSLVHERLLFSEDARYIFCPSGNDIKVFSIYSEECCITLKGHTDKVTSVITNPLNQLQIFSSSLNGELIKWDFSDNVLLKRFKVNCSAIYAMYAPTKMSKKIYAVADILDNGTNFVKLSFDASDNSSSVIDQKSLVSNVNQTSNCNDLGCLGSIFGFINRRSLHVFNLKEKVLIKHRASKNLILTCMRCHPTEICIATGLDNGKIYIWRDLFPEDGKQPIITIVHWHALSLRCLTFTPEGSYLLSGGYECVLVKWHLDTLHKDTLPRLGSPIINICASSDANLYALSHIDNGIQIITNTFKVIQTFQGLVKCHKDFQIKMLTPIDMKFNPRTDSIVLNGGPGQLQFFDWKRNVQLFRLDVVGENYVSPENLCNPLDHTEILFADFDFYGDWLATVEGRGHDYLSVLKFWAYDKEIKSFSLNTCVSTPHEKATTALKFKCVFHCKTRTDHLCVTTSTDATFKLWKLTDTSDIYKSSVGWRLYSSGSFKNFIPSALDFSFDGTILGLGFGSVLTFWDPSNCSLLHSDQIQLGDIKIINLEKYSNSFKLLFSTPGFLASYNILLYSVVWVIPLRVTSIATNPTSQEFAVFVDGEASINLQFFNTENSNFTNRFENVSKSRILSSLYVDNNLLYLNFDQELLEFKPFEESMETEETTVIDTFGKLLIENKSEVVEMWNNILGNKRIVEGKIYEGKNVECITMEKYNKIIEMPIYVMPPFEKLCMPFIEDYIKKAPTNEISKTDRPMFKEIIEESDSDDNDDEDDKDDDDDKDSELEIDLKESNDDLKFVNLL